METPAEHIVRIRARIRFLTTEEGGRSTPLAGGGSYRPNHNFGGPGNLEMCIGFIDIPAGAPVIPGATIDAEFEIMASSRMVANIREGADWRIQEGGRLVAIGNVLELV
jgi:elongation factor Tu